ncbi:MAG: hypothetical protein QXH27_04985, partial [Candidatus Micrarchaeia archaeon]
MEKGLLQKTSPNTQYAGKEWREALLDLAEAEELFLENASSAASSPAITPCSTQQKESSKSRMEGKSPLR